jgi:hypothetical protein
MVSRILGILSVMSSLEKIQKAPHMIIGIVHFTKPTTELQPCG